MGAQTVKIASPELLERAAKEAEQSGVTLEELATQALERELARRSFVRLRRAAEARRGGMTEEQITKVVEDAIHEYRAERNR